MKTKRLKPLLLVIALYLVPIGMVSTALTTPVFASEAVQSEELASSNQKTKLSHSVANETQNESDNIVIKKKISYAKTVSGPPKTVFGDPKIVFGAPKTVFGAPKAVLTC